MNRLIDGWITTLIEYITANNDTDDLVQDCSNSIANALELLQSWTMPSIHLTHSTESWKLVMPCLTVVIGKGHESINVKVLSFWQWASRGLVKPCFTVVIEEGQEFINVKLLWLLTSRGLNVKVLWMWASRVLMSKFSVCWCPGSFVPTLEEPARGSGVLPYSWAPEA